ncbi:MAG: hypothetical protein GY733_07375 [bacterium]|nr:hypothetical protein [bacterium]
MTRVKAGFFVRVIAILFVLVLGAGPALAGGWGGYLEGEFSNSKIKDHGIDRGFDAAMGGIGALWDSDISTADLLNFRLGAGYRLGERDLDEAKDETVNGLTLDATIGYGALRRQTFRVWGGPSARLNFDWYGSAGDVDVVDVAIGIGPRIGVNLNLGERLTLTASTSYHYMYLAEQIESNGSNRTVDGPQHMFGVRIGLLWRGEDDLWEPEDE